MGRFLNPGNKAFQKTLKSEIYVDKTMLLAYTNKVIGSDMACICNSRPRRFGKSITANMLAAYYSRGCDSFDMFSTLKVGRLDSFETNLNKYDVIHIDVQWCMMDADIQTGTSLTNDYIVVVKGRPVLDQVIENLNLNESYKTLGGRVTLDNPSNSRVLNITVTDPDPQMAKTIADEIAKVASAYIAEKMKQDPPTIIQSGYDDGGAVSPNIGKNTVIGAFAGAFLSIAVIVVSYLFNDTIIDTEDVEKKLGMNVLGTLPLDESEDDGEQGKGRKHGRGSHRKKRKKKSASA